jgi:hypothetical protein
MLKDDNIKREQSKNPYPQSFEYARDSVKQLLTLSTAIIGVSIALFKDVFKPCSIFPKILVTVTWSSFVISVLCGVMTLFAITANVAAIERRIAHGMDLHFIKGINSPNIKNKAAAQGYAFVIGILFVVISCATFIL